MFYSLAITISMNEQGIINIDHLIDYFYLKAGFFNQLNLGILRDR